MIIVRVGVGKRLLTHPSVLTSPGAGPVHLQHHAFDKIMACGEEVSGSEALHRAARFPPLLASLSSRAAPPPAPLGQCTLSLSANPTFCRSQTGGEWLQYV